MLGPLDNRPGVAIARMVRKRGIDDPSVLDAIAEFSREYFLPPQRRGEGSADRAVSIGMDQTISQPYIVAFMTAELILSGAERVLEIGTGSGYQTAILSRLAHEVFTVERLRTLSLRARGVLDGLGITNVRFRIGDGTLGWPDEAPFDRVIVTAGSPTMPPALFGQLAEGGLMIVPIGEQEGQRLTVIRKKNGQPEFREVLNCRFVRLIGEGGWAEG